MNIAVACDGMSVSAHAARCANFMCYTIKNGIIVGCRNLPNFNRSGIDLVDLASSLKFDVLLTGDIDNEAFQRLDAAGVDVQTHMQGSARQAADTYLSRTLLCAADLCS